MENASETIEFCEKLIGLTDKIKAVIYQVAKSDLLKKNISSDLCGKMAAAVTNELFGSHTSLSEKTMQKYGDVVFNELSNIENYHPELKHPISNALRIYGGAKSQLGEDLGPDLYEKAMERGLFFPNETMPSLDQFIAMVSGLYQKYVTDAAIPEP